MRDKQMRRRQIMRKCGGTQRNGGGRGAAVSAQDRVEEPKIEEPGWSGKGNGKSEELAGARYRRNGNVARLPKAVRDRINLMIEDGVPYVEIIGRLGEDGNGLDKSNLSRWKNGGYQDWVVEQAFIRRTRARQETAQELARDFDATEVNAAALQLGALHVFEALRDVGLGSLNQKLGGDCAAFARLLNALARASRETMMLQKYREACAQARAALKGLKDPNRKLTDAERRAIVLEVDEILGLRTQDDGDYDGVPPNSGPDTDNDAPSESRGQDEAATKSGESSELQTPAFNPGTNGDASNEPPGLEEQVKANRVNLQPSNSPPERQKVNPNDSSGTDWPGTAEREELCPN
jgi:hypothetical protein